MGKPTTFVRTWEAYSVSGLESAGDGAQRLPLIIAIHGGGFTSGYFDLPSYSLIERANEQGFAIIALDRPGYGSSSPFAAGSTNVVNNAERLDDVIGRICGESDLAQHGVFVVGHSIGGAITVALAARAPRWPLVGIAISGIGLTPPPGVDWSVMPDIEMVEIPDDLKDALLLGPPETHAPDMPLAAHIAYAAAPRSELIDIVGTWPSLAPDLAAKVRCPVHYRQGAFEKLWIANDDEVARLAVMFGNAPRVDARLVDGTGHCIDFHKPGAAFQLEQLAFAKACAT